MEPKSGSRTIKKSASGGALGDRKKAKQKKKKDKRKPSVKGTESTDVPSPELDSEVLLDGDVTITTDQEGLCTPVGGQVTRLPHLTSQTSVSLTTLTTSTPPPHHLATTTTTTTTRKISLGGAHSSNSAPTTRSSAAAAAATSSTLITIPTAANNLDGVVARVAHLNIKQRASKSRSKTQASSTKPGSKASRSKDNRGGNRGAQPKVSDASPSSKGGSQSGSATSNESLRWELALENVEEERERLAMYKMNRRKRYLAAAQAKGLGWAMNYTSQTNLATPLSEDSGVETACGSPGMTTMTSSTTSTTTAAASTSSTTAASAGPYIDFSSMQTLRPLPGHTGLQEAFVEC